MSSVDFIKVVEQIKKALPPNLRKRLPREIFVVPVSPQASCNINQRFYRKREPANVLSFRYGLCYGEIVVCPRVIRAQAKRAGNSYQFQMTWMIVHGMLHVAGLHHERSSIMAKKTERIEQEVLAKIFHPVRSRSRSKMIQSARVIL